MALATDCSAFVDFQLTEADNVASQGFGEDFVEAEKVKLAQIRLGTNCSVTYNDRSIAIT